MAVHVPGVLVDHVVVEPEQWQTTQTVFDPAISGESVRPEESFEVPDFGPEKVVARRVALELSQGMAVNIGFGIAANVPRILLEEGAHGTVTWVIEQGAVGGIPLLGFQFGCAANAEAIIPSPQQFTYLQGGGFDASLLSFLEIDRAGNVNVSRLAARPAGHRRRRRLRGHHGQCAAHRLRRLLHRRLRRSPSRAARSGSSAKGRCGSWSSGSST